MEKNYDNSFLIENILMGIDFFWLQTSARASEKKIQNGERERSEQAMTTSSAMMTKSKSDEINADDF